MVDVVLVFSLWIEADVARSYDLTIFLAAEAAAEYAVGYYAARALIASVPRFYCLFFGSKIIRTGVYVAFLVSTLNVIV